MKLLLSLLMLDLLFVGLHIFFGSQVDLLHLDRERTPASLYSALQFAGGSFAVAALSVILRRRGEKILFSSASLLFIFMAFDEISELHENITYYLVQYLPSFSFFGSQTPMWVVFLSPIIMGAFIVIVCVMRHMMRHTSYLWLYMVGGFISFAGALALEFFGNISTLKSFLPMFIILEEALELLGGSLFLYALMTYARTQFAILYHPK